MVRKRKSLIAWLILIFSGCNPVLEQQDVPVSISFELTPGTPAELIAENIRFAAENKFLPVMIQVPFGTDSSGAIRFHAETGNFIRITDSILQKNQIPWNLYFTARESEGFTEPAEAAYFIRSIHPAVDSLLGFAANKPENIFIGKNLKAIEAHPALFCERQGKFDFGLNYVSDIDRDISAELHACSEWMAVSYPPIPQENPKPWHRVRNRLLKQQADSLDKNIFIAEANLIGDDQQILFQNRLRFWDDRPLQGIVLNTMHNRNIFLDSLTYYGIRKNHAFKAYLDDYRYTE